MHCRRRAGECEQQAWVGALSLAFRGREPEGTGRQIPRWGLGAMRGLDLVLWVPPRLSGPFSPSEPPSGIFSTCWAFVIASLPLSSSAFGGPCRGLGALVPVCQACPPSAPPSPVGPSRCPPPAACSLPRAVCFPSWGRGEACFSSLLRNRASETHNAAVKISGSGWAHTASPLFSSEQQPPRRSRGSVPLLAECWGGVEGAGAAVCDDRETPEAPSGFCSFGALHGGRGWTMGVCNAAGWHIPEGCQPETFHFRRQRQRPWGGWRRVERTG